jgi:hypothetical protein
MEHYLFKVLTRTIFCNIKNPLIANITNLKVYFNSYNES